MSKIHRAWGRAGEYCENAVNLYMGCNHGCVYCYNPEDLKTTPEKFWTITPTKDTLKNIEEEANLYRGKQVFMSFQTDPYNELDQELKLTREALQLFRIYGVIPMLLTKAGLKGTRDFDLLDSTSWYGATLTFVDPGDSQRFEPGASLPQERFEALREAKARGITTWASLEPVIDPGQTIEAVHRTRDFVDHYKVGTWNYDERAKKIDYARFARDIVDVLKRYGKTYYIKKDLRDKARW